MVNRCTCCKEPIKGRAVTLSLDVCGHSAQRTMCGRCYVGVSDQSGKHAAYIMLTEVIEAVDQLRVVLRD